MEVGKMWVMVVVVVVVVYGIFTAGTAQSAGFSTLIVVAIIK
jgi:hypothetical protein